jgi:hypothetical protein
MNNDIIVSDTRCIGIDILALDRPAQITQPSEQRTRATSDLENPTWR